MKTFQKMSAFGVIVALVSAGPAFGQSAKTKTLRLSNGTSNLVDAPITEVHIELETPIGGGTPSFFVRIGSYPPGGKSVFCDLYTPSFTEAATLRSQVIAEATTLVICTSHNARKQQQQQSIEIFVHAPKNGDAIIISGGP